MGGCEGRGARVEVALDHHAQTCSRGWARGSGPAGRRMVRALRSRSHLASPHDAVTVAPASRGASRETTRGCRTAAGRPGCGGCAPAKRSLHPRDAAGTRDGGSETGAARVRSWRGFDRRRRGPFVLRKQGRGVRRVPSAAVCCVLVRGGCSPARAAAGGRRSCEARGGGSTGQPQGCGQGAGGRLEG